MDTNEPYFTEEQRLFRNQVRRFAEREVAPLVDEAEETETFPRIIAEKMGDLGYLGVYVDPKFGGGGGDVVMSCICAEEIARICVGIGGTVVVSAIATNSIYAFGTDAQKERYLKPVMEGRKIASIAMTEPDAGSDFKAIKTRARKVDGGWIIDGTKTFITNAPIADFVVVCCRSDDSESHKGITLFIVERGTTGYSVTKKLKKLGQHSSETGELLFEACFVPDENLVGEEGRGFYHMMENLSMERLWAAAGSLGLAEAAHEAAVRYAKERVQFGQPIGKFQMIRKILVDMQTKIACARHLLYCAALRVDQGEDPVAEVSMAKYHAAEIAKQVAGDALQVFGGNGYMMEYPVQRYVRDAQVGTIYAGSSQIMIEIIADRMGL